MIESCALLLALTTFAGPPPASPQYSASETSWPMARVSNPISPGEFLRPARFDTKNADNQSNARMTMASDSPLAQLLAAETVFASVSCQTWENYQNYIYTPSALNTICPINETTTLPSADPALFPDVNFSISISEIDETTRQLDMSWSTVAGVQFAPFGHSIQVITMIFGWEVQLDGWLEYYGDWLAIPGFDTEAGFTDRYGQLFRTHYIAFYLTEQEEFGALPMAIYYDYLPNGTVGLFGFQQVIAYSSGGVEGDWGRVSLATYESSQKFQITIPCPADMNGDGILDNGDIITFVNVFLAGDIAADMNGDSILDNGDIITFVDLFLAGCP